MSTWVKRSEREPTKADYPIAAGAYLSNQTGGYWDEGHYRIPEALTNWQTHWRSIKADPPARELTQREKDQDTMLRILKESTGFYDQDILQAIYAERREMAKLIGELFPHSPTWGTHTPFSDEWKAIRARLDEQGGSK